MGTRIKKYARIWRCLVANSFHTQMSTSFGSAGYLLGKLLRLFFLLGYLLALFRHTETLKGYTVAEVVLFLMTFNIVDVGSQFLFRGLYGIKYLIEEGDFDKILTQPAHPLFRISFMGVDLLDLLTLIPVGAVTVWSWIQLPTPLTGRGIFLFALLLLNAMLLSYSIHVFIACLSVKTQEFESAMWVYRDMMSLGRFPVSIYSDTIRFILITVLPIGVLVSFPAQALLGALSLKFILYSFFTSFLFYAASQKCWRYCLREYTSNSY